MQSEIVSCCTCGYEWRRGQHGGHSCTERMAQTISAQAAEIERLRAALAEIAGSDMTRNGVRMMCAEALGDGND